MGKTKDVLLDHDYDGIKELDNDLPPWWLWMFYITIFWAAIYLLHYHVFKTGKSQIVKYQQEINPNWKPPAKGQQDSYLGILPKYRSPYYSPQGDVTPKILDQFSTYIGPDIGFDDLIKEAMLRADADNLEKLKAAFPDLYAEVTSSSGPITAKAKTAARGTMAKKAPTKQYTALTDKASLVKGKQIFMKNCATCHGKLGEGGIGPNLTDAYWLHGGSIDDIVHTIKVGVPAKGMISWQPVLKEDQILQVASYILTLYGTNPPNAKKPQGEKVEMAGPK